MQLVIKLNVSAAQLFEKIESSVRYDIKNQTHKNHVGLLEGFTYKKEMSNREVAEVTIVKFQAPFVYQYVTRSRVNEITSTYSISENDAHSCTVNYKESMNSIHFIQRMNDELVGYLYNFSRKKRMKQMMRAIEQSILVH